jgi:phosphoribosyl 1,2-cyclic phosphodiesterase
MGDNSSLRLKFWGVRGTVPTPASSHLDYGGNTTCIEVRSGDGIVMIDAGTGCVHLGASLQNEFPSSGLTLRVLMTHFHWDHIQGLPHFAPLYSPTNKIIFHSSRPPEQTREILEGQMSDPYYPISLDCLPAQKDFVDIGSSPFRDCEITAHPFPLHHPQGATGYRLESKGKVITHASDVEHGHDMLDKTLREFAQDADVLIYDAQYTPSEYVSWKGRGHSTWLEATRVARDSHVGRLILFHHDPKHDDGCMREILGEARRHFENTDVATEGIEIAI